jgi:hypothetical protein
MLSLFVFFLENIYYLSTDFFCDNLYVLCILCLLIFFNMHYM